MKNTSGPVTAAFMAKMGLLTMDTRNIPEAWIMLEHLFKVSDANGMRVDMKAAAKYLETPIKTVYRWYGEKRFPPMATKLLEIKFRGYLPYTKGWSMFYFDIEDNLVTPHGVVTPGDVAMIHQTKWKAEQSYEKWQNLKSSLDAEFQKTKDDAIAQKMKEIEQLINCQTPGDLDNSITNPPNKKTG